jgi:glycosyltransferase involved in cell wall biosynthesis
MKSVLSIVLNEFTHDNRVLNEAISLRKAGYNLSVIALHTEPLKEWDEVGGVPVHRIKLSSRNLKSFKVIKHLEYMYRTFRFYRKKNIDIIHCHDLTALPLGYLFKKFVTRKTKVVYDAHEYETEMNGLSGIRQVMYRILERYLIRFADKVITVSERIGKEYVRLYTIPEPVIILNCPWKRESTERFDLFRQEFGIRQEQTIFLYQGILAKGRGVEILLQSFSQRDNNENVIVFMGFGPMDQDIIEVSKKSDKVFFHQAVAPPRFLDYTASADFGISFIEDISLSDRYCLPNKLFEYLNAGVPVICSNLPEMRKFVEDHGVGFVAEENTAEGLTGAVNTTLRLEKPLLRENVRIAADKFCWETQEIVLKELYSDMIGL